MGRLYKCIVTAATLMFIGHYVYAQTVTGYYISNGSKISYSFKPVAFQLDPNSYPDMSGSIDNSYGYINFKNNFRQIADSAIIIAAAVLNSQEFRDSIAKYTFPCKNYLDNCRSKCSDCNHDEIPTKVILDSLYREKRKPIRLIMHNDGDCDDGGSFGYSYENDFEVNSHYITIHCDDTLSFAYKYGYHLAHEYMHIVGFYHYLPPRRRIRYKDIAEATGWIAYYIVKRWKENNIPILGLEAVK